MHEVTYALDHLTLRAIESGQGQPETIIALHGWLDNASSFNELRKHLTNFHFVALDLAGHGHSDHRPPGDTYYIWENVSDLLSLMDLHGYNKVTLLGHSMGASVAVLFAALFPERVNRLYMIEGMGPPVYDEKKLPQLMAEAILKQKRLKRRTLRPYPDLESAIKVRMTSRWPVSRQSAEWLVERGVKHDETGYSWCSDHRLMLPSINRMTEKQVMSCLKAVKAPVRLYLGLDGIDMSDAQARMDQLDKLDVIRLPGNHHLHMDAEPALRIATDINNTLV
ncbi:alpha/beta hydrolase [Neptunomonas phycophila]|jgi:pimeloyl-ACP methyl ester carboxylesterase|uniref:Alpha/beta hydrolase n=1 Tax=Neptunomonas phycophila TaxID=1572645 RepID=A0AAW7XLM8_9GAMM|nr:MULTISPECIES: alpha/beta hydrolase [Neptunomonas]MBT3147140.1 alpha/beta fold hydrolase [Neptunomonas phycophila]MDN2660375.1 alpha/beta hydrolase [Neptunomonas sp. CHC150]MDO6453937.1 alpha/beta hydrolase [Neptunomonas phycophila]MDO6469470.1 alpha/beta hydrolase [Neptunomonas phycophila]MDO6785716.1 alpha/beta hydrolase [Neptunomonas phycophila]